MNDLNKLLYNLLEQRQAQSAEHRLEDKRVDDDTIEVTLDYRDTPIQNYVILVQDQTILIRYDTGNNDLRQDALQLAHDVRPESMSHRHDNGYLTISIKRGGNHGKQTNRS